MREFCPQCDQYTYDNDGNRGYKKCHNLKCLYIEGTNINETIKNPTEQLLTACPSVVSTK